MESLPSAWPSWLPKAIPPIWDIIASSGPAIAWASCGSAEAHTVEICSATGSHSRFQVSRVLSSHSVGVQATVRVVPAGSAVAPSSQVSASRTASAIADAGRFGYRRHETDRTRCQLAGQVVVDRSGLLAAGGHIACTAEHLAEPGEDLAEVGHVETFTAHPERIPGGIFLALVRIRVVSVGEAEGQVRHSVNGTHRRRCGWGRGSR